MPDEFDGSAVNCVSSSRKYERSSLVKQARPVSIAWVFEAPALSPVQFAQPALRPHVPEAPHWLLPQAQMQWIARRSGALDTQWCTTLRRK